MTDFLESKQTEINRRIAELRPQVDEYQRLQSAATALAGISPPATTNRNESTTATSKPTRRPGRPRTSKSTTAATTRSGRPKGSGLRASQAVTLITEQPGITIPELATKMSIKQNYLYRVLPGLQQENKIAKQGRGWHPA